jgi:hypothetical protein
MMNDHRSQPKFDGGPFGNLPQLMLGHFAVRLVIDSVDFAPILRSLAQSPENRLSRLRRDRLGSLTH